MLLELRTVGSADLTIVVNGETISWPIATLHDTWHHAIARAVEGVLRQAGIERARGLLACKHADGQWNTRPHRETVVQPGCQMIALGTLPNLRTLLALARGDSPSS